MAGAIKQREKTRHAGGLRGGPIMACLVCIFAGVWAAGQYVAYALAYQPQLGRPWLRLGENSLVQFGHGKYQQRIQATAVRRFHRRQTEAVRALGVEGEQEGAGERVQGVSGWRRPGTLPGRRRTGTPR